MINASAPAKIILVGEHAVVYGQPAIAIPVSSLRAYAHAAPNTGGLRIVAADLDETVPVNVDSVRVDKALDHALARTARLVLDRLHAPPPDQTITLRSDIPVASGLGSGAAVSAALARALASALGQPLDDAALNEIVYEVEKLHHGTPSGIDNTVVVYEQPIYFMRGEPMESISIGAPFTLLIADTGQGALTRIAVGDVRALFHAEPERIGLIVDEIGLLVRAARDYIERGDVKALGPLLTRNHALLQTLTVSSPDLDRLVQAALDAGALGAKLSGGGRGGTMIALVMPESASQVAQALTESGAVRVIESVVK